MPSACSYCSTSTTNNSKKKKSTNSNCSTQKIKKGKQKGFCCVFYAKNIPSHFIVYLHLSSVIAPDAFYPKYVLLIVICQYFINVLCFTTNSKKTATSNYFPFLYLYFVCIFMYFINKNNVLLLYPLFFHFFIQSIFDICSFFFVFQFCFFFFSTKYVPILCCLRFK